MDAMGHGLSSARVAGLAMGVYRHGRREARTLLGLHRSLSDALHHPPARPDLRHRPARPARHHQRSVDLDQRRAPPAVADPRWPVIGELSCPPTPPWGLVDGTPTLATEALGPGDSLLLYTDGVIDARTPEGELFGVDRLVDLTQAHASDLLDPAEIVRVLVRSVLDHQQIPAPGRRHDDLPALERSRPRMSSGIVDRPPITQLLPKDIEASRSSAPRAVPAPPR